MMPAAPDFDLYEVLEIQKTASAQEIKESYRRLALIHHPDKNPGDAAATARFQRIGLAHETLSDTTLRARYDYRYSPSTQRYPPPQPTSSTSPRFYRDDPYYDGDEDDDDSGFASFSYEEFLRQFAQNFRNNREQMEEERRRVAAARAQYEKEEAIRQQLRAERAKREAEAEAKRQARSNAKQAAEEEKQKAYQTREQQERALNELRWSTFNAVTDAEKQSVCLHSEFWPREPPSKKFKCGSCGKKSGPMAFKCPHCSLLTCQKCLSKFSHYRSA